MVSSRVGAYDPKQMQQVMDFIKAKFDKGVFGEDGWVMHEFVSEYVHTDVAVVGNEDGKYLVTCGMGAKQMCRWVKIGEEELDRIELIAMFSPQYDLDLAEVKVEGGELISISKYPFRENTFLGPFHTINVSDAFKEKYGYDYFLFYVPIEHLEVDGLGKVYFLPLIPVYEEEREWMVRGNSIVYMRALLEKFGDEVFLIDKKREVFIP